MRQPLSAAASSNASTASALQSHISWLSSASYADDIAGKLRATMTVAHDDIDSGSGWVFSDVPSDAITRLKQSWTMLHQPKWGSPPSSLQSQSSSGDCADNESHSAAIAASSSAPLPSSAFQHPSMRGNPQPQLPSSSSMSQPRLEPSGSSGVGAFSSTIQTREWNAPPRAPPPTSNPSSSYFDNDDDFDSLLMQDENLLRQTDSRANPIQQQQQPTRALPPLITNQYQQHQSPSTFNSNYNSSSSFNSPFNSAATPSAMSMPSVQRSSSSSPPPTLVSMARETLPLNPTVNSEWSGTNYAWSELLTRLNKDMFGFNQFRPNQREIINAVLSKRDVFVLMPTGAGKCFARGTEIRLYNGDVKPVELIMANELLMGDDSQPRIVTPGSLIRGRARMYKIMPNRDGATSFIVNGDHILVLTVTAKPSVKKFNLGNSNGFKVVWFELRDGQVKQMSHRFVIQQSESAAIAEANAETLKEELLADWQPIQWDVSVRDFQRAVKDVQHVTKLVAAQAVTFQSPMPALFQILTGILGCSPSWAQLKWAAWLIGMWIADGITGSDWISQGGPPQGKPKSHFEIMARIEQYSRLFGERVRKHFNNKSGAVNNVYVFKFGEPFVPSIVRRLLMAYGLLNNKHVPPALLRDTLLVRRCFLAGVIDGDGHYQRVDNEYELPAKTWATVVGFKDIGASLGLRNSHPAPHKWYSTDKDRVYNGFRVKLTGDMWDVAEHCAATYKRCPEPGTDDYAEKNKDSRCYGFSIEELPVDDYFGFAVHGGANHRFLLRDFTVTHNSMTYQLPALVRDGLSVVFSPLISLIQDQITGLTTLDIPAAALNGATSSAENKRVWRDAISGALKLLYITPEKLSHSPGMMNLLKELNGRNRLQCFVIDEAHCVTNWGHDFRPDYRNLQCLKQHFPTVPIMALTATASNQVQIDVISTLGLHEPVLFKQSFNRSNLYYEVRPKSKAIESMVEFIQSRHRHHSGIVYCASIADCEKVCKELQSVGLSAEFYHGKMDSETRQVQQNRWSNDEVRIMVATMAFGMGINKPDVRFVIHYSFPKSIEAYSQETGRAGRDGQPADCVLYYSYGDKQKNEFLIRREEQGGQPKSKAVIANNINKLYQMIHFLEDDVTCRRQLMLSFLGESFDSKLCSKNCDNCKRHTNDSVQSIDVTSIVLDFIGIVDEVNRFATECKLDTVLNIYKGSASKAMKDSGYVNNSLYGVGKQHSQFGQHEYQRILHHAVMQNVFVEYSETLQHGLYQNTVVKIGLGDKARAVRDGTFTLTMNFALKRKSFAKNKNASKNKESESEEEPQRGRGRRAPTEAIEPNTSPLQSALPSTSRRMTTPELTSPASGFGSAVARNRAKSSKNQSAQESFVDDNDFENNFAASNTSSARAAYSPYHPPPAPAPQPANSATSEASPMDADGTEALMDEEQVELLMDELSTARANIARHSLDKPKPHMIASLETMAWMARELPMNVDTIANAPGFGLARARKYGPEFIRVINQFITDNRIALAPAKRRQRELYQQSLRAREESTVDLTMTQIEHTDNLFNSYRYQGQDTAPTTVNPAGGPLKRPYADASSADDGWPNKRPSR